MMPINTGHPTNSGTQANNSAIKQVNSGKILEALKQKTGAIELADREFEAKLAQKGQGDSITADVLGTPVLKPYTRGQTIVYDTTNSGTVKFPVTTAKYGAIQLDRIDEHQSSVPILSKYNQRFVNVLADDMNIHVATQVNAGAVAVGNVFTASVDRNNLIDTLLQFEQDFQDRLAFIEPGDKLTLAMPHTTKGLFKRHYYSKATPDMPEDGSPKNLNVEDSIMLGPNFKVVFDSTLQRDVTGAYQCPATITGGYMFFNTIQETGEMIDLQTTFGKGLRVLSVYGGGVAYDAKVGMLRSTFSFA